MENSIESTIEKIKLQEHDNETKLKEKRTYDSMVLSLSRGVRDAMTNASKLKHDNLEVEERIDALRSRLQIEKLRQTALTALLKQTHEELLSQQELSAKGITYIWNLRSELCTSVQNVSDQCDVWALLSKPRVQLPLPRRMVETVENIESTNECCDKLNNAIQKHTELQAEKNRLQNEPDKGEEFVRIKNALRYSATMAANLK